MPRPPRTRLLSRPNGAPRITDRPLTAISGRRLIRPLTVATLDPDRLARCYVPLVADAASLLTSAPRVIRVGLGPPFYIAWRLRHRPPPTKRRFYMGRPFRPAMAQYSATRLICHQLNKRISYATSLP